MKFGKTTVYLLKFIFICVLSAGLAYAFNAVRPDSYTFEKLVHPEPKGIEEISTSEVLAAYDTGKVQMVDARSDMDFAMGHVPGAVNIPSWAIHEELSSLAKALDRNQPVIVYCDGLSCGKSRIVAKKLLAMGFGNVKVYTDGIDGWLGAGRDLEAN